MINTTEKKNNSKNIIENYEQNIIANKFYFFFYSFEFYYMQMMKTCRDDILAQFESRLAQGLGKYF